MAAHQAVEPRRQCRPFDRRSGADGEGTHLRVVRSFMGMTLVVPVIVVTRGRVVACAEPTLHFGQSSRRVRPAISEQQRSQIEIRGLGVDNQRQTVQRLQASRPPPWWRRPPW